MLVSSTSRPFPSSLHAFINCFCVPRLSFVPAHLLANLISVLFNTLICSAARKFIRRSRRSNIWKLLRSRTVHPFWGNEAWRPAPPVELRLWCVWYRSESLLPECWYLDVARTIAMIYYTTNSVPTANIAIIMTTLSPPPSSVPHLQSDCEAFTRYS